MTPIPAWAVLTLEYARGRILPRYAQAASTPVMLGQHYFPPQGLLGVMSPQGCPGQYKATQEEPQGTPATGEGWWQQDTMGPVTWRQTRQLLHPWSSSHAARDEARTLGLSTGVLDMQQPESTLAHRHMHKPQACSQCPFPASPARPQASSPSSRHQDSHPGRFLQGPFSWALSASFPSSAAVRGCLGRAATGVLKAPKADKAKRSRDPEASTAHGRHGEAWDGHAHLHGRRSGPPRSYTEQPHADGRERAMRENVSLGQDHTRPPQQCGRYPAMEGLGIPRAAGQGTVAWPALWPVKCRLLAARVPEHTASRAWSPSNTQPVCTGGSHTAAGPLSLFSPTVSSPMLVTSHFPRASSAPSLTSPAPDTGQPSTPYTHNQSSHAAHTLCPPPPGEEDARTLGYTQRTLSLHPTSVSKGVGK